MGFRFRRSVKLFPGLRLNFGKRGISASIGVRGAHVTYGPAGTRTTIGLPGTGVSYTHLDKPHRALPRPSVTAPPVDEGSTQGSALRGSLWIGLIVAGIVFAISRLTTPAPPVQPPSPAQSLPPPAARDAAQAANDMRLEAERAALGLTQIRRAVANANTLQLARVTAMPTGVICYQFHLRNSHGVGYVRTALLDSGVLSTSASNGYTALWNRRCVYASGRDITSDVQDVIRRSAP